VIRWANPASPTDTIPCLFLEEGVERDCFRAAYERSRNDRASFFNRALTARRDLRDGSIVSLRGDTLAHKHPDGRVTTQSAPEGAPRTRALIEVFGFSPDIVARLPSDEPPQAH
jgi:hypothetical protein